MTRPNISHRRHHGLTLVELLVAIVILSVLGVMSYRALEHAANSRDRLSADYNAWQSLSRSLAMIENNLQQVVMRGGSFNKGAPILLRNKDLKDKDRAAVANAAQGNTDQIGTESQLIFERSSALHGTQLVGFSLYGDQLQLLRWPESDISLEPKRDVLLDGITTLTWLFYRPGEKTWSAIPPTSSELPAGIKLEIETTRYGKITRVFAPR